MGRKDLSDQPCVVCSRDPREHPRVYGSWCKECRKAYTDTTRMNKTKLQILKEALGALGVI